MSATVTVQGDAIRKARSIAIARFGRQKDNPNAKYRNTLGGHFIGSSGELAVLLWARDCGRDVEGYFTNLEDEGQPDLAIDEKRIETKTWALRTWKRGGRCLMPDHVQEYKDRKIDAVIWCHLTSDPFGKASRLVNRDDLDRTERVSVLLAGWSTVKEIEAAPVRDTSFGDMPRMNHQVDAMRDIETLLE